MDDDISSKTRNAGPSFFEGLAPDPRDTYITEISKRGGFLIDETIVTGYGSTAREAEADAHLNYSLHKEGQSYLAQERAEKERLASLGSGSYSRSYLTNYPHNSSHASEWRTHASEWLKMAILLLSLFGVSKCAVWCMYTEVGRTTGNTSDLDNSVILRALK